MDEHKISGKHLSIENLGQLLKAKSKLKLSKEAKVKIGDCRKYLDKKMKGGNNAFYGINTGFGKFCDVVIPDNQLEELQSNLILSHAVGLGDEVPEDIVRLMLILKIQSLSYGHSGIREKLVNRLIDFYNSDCLPVVYEQGSLGASGDLAPLSHLSLPLLGVGEVHLAGKRMKASTALKRLKMEPLKLQSKEGLALINGTQFMGAYGAYNLLRSKFLCEAADLIGSISLEAFDGRTDPFYNKLHQIRKQKGQIESAKKIRAYLKGSQIGKRKKIQVQDPYSFRCMPQVHGASRNTLKHVSEVFTDEINAVTDNPNIFPEADKIISGGNFHGQALALTADYLAMAVAELGNISERRTYLLLSGTRGLPMFLSAQPGLHSGLMIPQYTAASIVSQSKQLCTPASIDSIPSSNGQEDHVSMGANAVTKCLKVVQNTEKVLAIELLTAAQAMGFRKDFKISPKLRPVLRELAQFVPFNQADRFLRKDINACIDFIHNKLEHFIIK